MKWARAGMSQEMQHSHPCPVCGFPPPSSIPALPERSRGADNSEAPGWHQAAPDTSGPAAFLSTSCPSAAAASWSALG